MVICKPSARSFGYLTKNKKAKRFKNKSLEYVNRERELGLDRRETG